MSTNDGDRYFKQLFDFQRFSPDDKLQKVIDNSLERLKKERENLLNDDVLNIYAAGDIDSTRGGSGDDD